MQISKQRVNNDRRRVMTRNIETRGDIGQVDASSEARTEIVLINATGAREDGAAGSLMCRR